MSLVQISGPATLTPRLKALLRKYAHLFRTSVSQFEADVSPLVLKVDKTQWDSPTNGGPARVQSVQKQRALDAEIAKLLELGVIEISHADHSPPSASRSKGKHGPHRSAHLSVMHRFSAYECGYQVARGLAPAKHQQHAPRARR